ncbi:MAG: hypothetical protein U0T68_04900 [Ferruginibacter sp.]
MKFLFLFSCLLITAYGEAQLTTKVEWTEKTSMPASEIIYYNPSNKLVWANFKGKPQDLGGRTAAITMSGFGYAASMHSTGKTGELTVQVYCFFNKNKSWVKPGKTTDYILAHEQHHFDIAYIAANIFIDKLQSAVMTPGNYNVLLPRIYNECIEVMNAMQDDYDNETRNGQEIEMQSKWNKFIDDKIGLITK